jgi:hypothetical protein
VTSGSPILVLHDIGDRNGGAPWRDALEDAGWPGPVLAPDLPGHCGEPGPIDGAYELVDAAWHSLRLLHAAALETLPVIVGVGTNGWSAELLGLGGRAAGVVLVDGLGGPWLTPAEWVDAQRTWIRVVADDTDDLAGADGLDPRLRHGVPGLSSEPMATRVASALEAPVLIVQTPAAALIGAAADELVNAFRSATVEHLAEQSPEQIAPLVVRWANRAAIRGSSSMER